MSSTDRAIGPTVSRDMASGTTPSSGYRPVVGLKPITPQNAAGTRSDPPVSVPSAARTRPPATAAALPPLEPPALRLSDLRGLRTKPKAVLSEVTPNASSCMLALAMTWAPAVDSL